ncbi:MULTISPECIES: cysteine hydrolase family protein [Brevibacterium]|uniref:Isochorismatase family protein n=1 Tax=Brevibacterium salitolerans TaxID=1403566 RepID=A0ABN2WFI4_9MICO|nr:isochorismatase family protein [Brevibacterium sp.]
MTTALLVLDVQESFRARPLWSQVSNPQIVDRVNRLVAAARAGGHAVHWIWHAEPGSGTVFDPERGFVRPLEGLDVDDGEPQLTKTSRNAFTTTGLAQRLTAAGVTDLVIAGIQTEQCCETTARVAADLGYSVTFVTEATATFPVTRPDTGATLSTDAVIERTEFALAGRFARIATVDTAFAAAALAAAHE